MSVNFFEKRCQTFSSKSKFGLCDDPFMPNTQAKPAYIDEANGEKWIATINNYFGYEVTFTAIDHCINFPFNADENASKRCDGVLIYNNTIAFVELKERSG